MDFKPTFRAKRLTTGQWDTGDYKTDRDLTAWIKKKSAWHQIDPNTTGQFVGIYDCNDKPIFTGDYISINYKYDALGPNGGVTPDQDCICEGVVEYVPEFACFAIRLYKAERPIKTDLDECPYLTIPLMEFDLIPDSIEILGNIYDNPELTEGGDPYLCKE